MKIKKSMFKSLKGLKELKQMKETGYCNGIECSRCPLDRRNLNTSIVCDDIIDLDGYAAKDLEETKKMNKLIDIFTKEKINTNLALIDERLKYNSTVMYNGKPYMIKGVLKKSFIKNKENPILLNGFSDRYNAIYGECIVRESDMKKKYTLWVDVKNIEILEK
jgi:hypothetical protein